MDKLTVAIIGISVLVGASPFLVEATSVQKTSTQLPANVTFVQGETKEGNVSVGVNAGSNLDFGVAPLNVGVEKTISLEAPNNTLVVTSSSGNITDVLQYDRKKYISGSSDVELRVNGTSPGYYEGQVEVKTMTPENKLGDSWLYVKSGHWLPF